MARREVLMGAASSKAKEPVRREDAPRVRHFDTVARAERLTNRDETRHYVNVPADDPNVMGNYRALGYEEEKYSPDGVRYASDKVTEAMFGRSIERRGCVLMSISKAQKKEMDDEGRAQYDEMYRQIYANRSGLSDGEAPFVRGRSGQRAAWSQNQTGRPYRTGVSNVGVEE